MLIDGTKTLQPHQLILNIERQKSDRYENEFLILVGD